MSLDALLHGSDLFGDSMREPVSAPLAAKFLVPPFSVLNARDGIWQERKRAWLSLGFRSEIGREGCASKLRMSETVQRLKPCADQAAVFRPIPGGGTGKNSAYMFRTAEGYEASEEAQESGTSIFDPVLCELVYRWFSRGGSQVLDPFAGGSVRGIVASLLGRSYFGGELRAQQVEANREQAALLCSSLPPEYVCGCSMETMIDAPKSDLVFSCPPYGDLEVYSDDPSDLSAMGWEAFLRAYRVIIGTACLNLRENRFACFVVGDFRAKDGFYRNFVGETIRAFMDAGLALYNEAILVTSVGSLPIRITKQFEAGRKLGKTHQNVLIFCKGDWKKAAQYVTEPTNP